MKKLLVLLSERIDMLEKDFKETIISINIIDNKNALIYVKDIYNTTYIKHYVVILDILTLDKIITL